MLPARAIKASSRPAIVEAGRTGVASSPAEWMEEQYAVVITTINPPTRAVAEIARDAGRLSAHFVVIGDEKTPDDFDQPGADYLDIAAQQASGFRFAELCPARHYARKNLGYLAATRAGATVIVETDDDNIPIEGFWNARSRRVNAPVLTDPGWCNVYNLFTDKLIWPRGLPLTEVHKPVRSYPSLSPGDADCPIQQGLADGDPDVDAVYRLLLSLPVHFDKTRAVILGQGVWCPFNSQNTTFFCDAFPLLYLPFYCSWRVTDIWRSLIAQRIAWANGWNLLFHGPTVFQDRNEHDLMRDFAEEVPGYLHNDSIRKRLEDMDFPAGVGQIPGNVIKCYDVLISLGLVGTKEAPLLRAWLTDLSTANGTSS